MVVSEGDPKSLVNVIITDAIDLTITSATTLHRVRWRDKIHITNPNLLGFTQPKYDDIYWLL